MIHSELFPFAEEIRLSENLSVHYELVLRLLSEQLTDERKKRIREVIEQRTFDVSVVCEGIYDKGNVSAVMRSAEAFGFAPFHVIENSEKFKNSSRITRGSEKWLEIQKWKSSSECLTFLKKQQRQLIVTSLDADISIDDASERIDFSKPCALVLGNEKEGVSEEMLAAADYKIKIPMYGFVQSFNISVAAALCLYHISQKRRKFQFLNSLSLVQKKILEAIYTLRTLDSAEDQLRNYFQRNS